MRVVAPGECLCGDLDSLDLGGKMRGGAHEVQRRDRYWISGSGSILVKIVQKACFSCDQLKLASGVS